MATLGEILAGCHQLLRPGGLLVLTARPWRRREQLVDFPGQLTRTAEAAGLVPFERDVALLVGLRGDRLVYVGEQARFSLTREQVGQIKVPMLIGVGTKDVSFAPRQLPKSRHARAVPPSSKVPRAAACSSGSPSRTSRAAPQLGPRRSL